MTEEDGDKGEEGKVKGSSKLKILRKKISLTKNKTQTQEYSHVQYHPYRPWRRQSLLLPKSRSKIMVMESMDCE